MHKKAITDESTDLEIEQSISVVMKIILFDLNKGAIMSEMYTMTITLNVLNHLGVNLYSNIPSVLSEVVANSWDADAMSVEINIDSENKTITIVDDGNGMTPEEVNEHYLSVGYAKREGNNHVSPVFHRRYMGRKGIGKLSMFSMAKTIDVITRKNGVVSSFRMEVDDITRAISGDSNTYHPKNLGIVADDDLPSNGTKIILTNLKKNISAATPNYIRKRIARRFSVIGNEYCFSVKVNGEPITITDRNFCAKAEYIWCYGDGDQSPESSSQAVKKVRRENVVSVGDRDYRVQGWIGTMASTTDLKDSDENLNRIVLIVRGKVGQEDVLSELSEGGLHTKYLMGEIHADFFDEDDQEDMATSGRKEYRKDDPRYEALLQFLKEELRQIKHDWTEFRNEDGLEKAIGINPRIKDWYDSLSPDDQKAARGLFGKVNQIVEDDTKRREILRYGLMAFEKLRYSHQLRLLDTLDANNVEALGSIITGFDDIEASLYYQIVKSRIEIIQYFQTLVDENDKERAIQEHLFNHLWLLDPSWERAEQTEFMERRMETALRQISDKLTQEEREGRLDIGYRMTAGKHVVIELKRAGRIVTFSELSSQVMKYKSALEKVLREAGMPLTYEFVVVLGKPINGDDGIENRQLISDMLYHLRCRIVYYDELINNAYRAYQEYIEKSSHSQRLVQILEELSDDNTE